MKKIFFLLLLIFSFIEKSFAQGCSDAGICTIPFHSSAVLNADKKVKNSLTTDISFGLGEGSTSVLTGSLLYRRKIGKKFSWDNKVTASRISGSLGNIFNAGDLYSTLSYSVPGIKKTAMNVVAGIKIPFTSSNDKIKGQPLPMAYQASLGTYDLVLGAAWVFRKKIDLNTAIQIPVINANKNTFFREYSTEMDFESTNNFQRKADVLLRLGYILKSKNNKWALNPNALAIVHLGKDYYENIFGRKESIDGSTGLTLNLNLQAMYQITKQRSIGFSIASPVIVRQSRPDGLTRSLTTSVNYQFGF